MNIFRHSINSLQHSPLCGCNNDESIRSLSAQDNHPHQTEGVTTTYHKDDKNHMDFNYNNNEIQESGENDGSFSMR